MLVHPDDLLLIKEVYWPHVTFADYQVEVLDSTLRNRETHVPAANGMGKDFIAGFIAIGCFIVCLHRNVTCRIITTSVAEHHLKVLWGEIGRFINTSTQPLIDSQGGQLRVNEMEIRRTSEWASKNPINYLVGRVSAKGEGLAGHHAQFTLLIGDEASGLDDEAYKMGQGWAQHMLFIGNPNWTQNFWKKAIVAGDLLAD